MICNAIACTGSSKHFSKSNVRDSKVCLVKAGSENNKMYSTSPLYQCQFSFWLGKNLNVCKTNPLLSRLELHKTLRLLQPFLPDFTNDHQFRRETEKNGHSAKQGVEGTRQMNLILLPSV